GAGGGGTVATCDDSSRGRPGDDRYRRVPPRAGGTGAAPGRCRGYSTLVGRMDVASELTKPQSMPAARQAASAQDVPVSAATAAAQWVTDSASRAQATAPGTQAQRRQPAR